MTAAVLAVGANVHGAWGAPDVTLARLAPGLRRLGLTVVCCSSIYQTRPMSGTDQPDYLNGTILVRTALAPRALLGRLKQLERAAGRRPGPRNAPRPLDLDILDYGGRVIGWPVRARRLGQLVVPHGDMHRRGFVLFPMAEMAPRWRHPVLGVGAAALLRRLGRSEREPPPCIVVSGFPFATRRCRFARFTRSR